MNTNTDPLSDMTAISPSRLLTVCAGNYTNLLHTPTKQQLCSSQLLTVNLKSPAENTDGRLNGWTFAQKSQVPSQMRLCG